MKKILFIAHTFYPSNRPNAKRSFLTAKAFLEKSWDVEVLASDIGLSAEAKEAFPDLSKFRVVRLKDPLWRLHDWISGRKERFWKGVDALLFALAWPDLSIFWVFKAAWWLQNKKYDAVVCSIYPQSVLLLPFLLKWLNTSWIVDYQDSVSAQFKRHPRKSPLHHILFFLLAKIEKSALKQADCALFTSESNRKAYISDGLVDSEKTSYISQFFEEDFYARSLRWDGNVLNIVYAGNFDRVGRRTPDVFLKALSGFLEKHPEAVEKIIVDFYVRRWPECNQFIERLGLQEIVSIHPMVPYKEYLKLLQTSAVLLLVTAPVHNLFIPGKLLDYFGACRPVLAFTPPDSETTGVLRSANVKSYICSDTDVSRGVRVIEEIWKDYCERKLSASAPNEVAAWSSKILAEQFVGCIEAALISNTIEV